MNKKAQVAVELMVKGHRDLAEELTAAGKWSQEGDTYFIDFESTMDDSALQLHVSNRDSMHSEKPGKTWHARMVDHFSEHVYWRISRPTREEAMAAGVKEAKKFFKNMASAATKNLGRLP